MDLFTPDVGLLFWMLLSFGIVLFVLAKWGFPVITRMVDDRKQYIDQSLEAARQANEKLAHIQEESEAVLRQTCEEQAKILKEAVVTRNQIIEEAREKARIEGQRMLEETRIQLAHEKETAMRDIRRQTAEIAIGVAEKIMRNNLTNERQHIELVERLVGESAKRKEE